MALRLALFVSTLFLCCCCAAGPYDAVREALTAGNPARALRELEAITGPSRESAVWHGLASEVYEALSDPARAVAECERALSIEPGREAWHLQLGQIFLRYHTPQAALDIYSEALQRFPDSILLKLGRGLAYKDLASYDEAELDLKDCLKREPGLPLAFDALATVYLQSKRFGDLISVAQRFRQSNAADYRSWYFEAAALSTVSQHDGKAESLVREAVRRNPDFAAAHALLGKILLQSGQPEDALAPLNEAARLRPDYSPAYLYLSKAYRELGRTDDMERALANWRKARAIENTPAPALAYHRGPAH